MWFLSRLHDVLEALTAETSVVLLCRLGWKDLFPRARGCLVPKVGVGVAVQILLGDGDHHAVEARQQTQFRTGR